MTTTKTCPQCGATYDPDQRFCALDGSALRGQDPGAGLIGEVVAERYLVQRRLGEGGMGEVYLAEHVRMGRPSALKVMRTAMTADADAVSRFNREAANASRIAHPNVAAIYDFGETPDGLIYLAMEYVDGEPLRATMERVGALPPARVARLVSQVAEALDAAHALGIVHRDLKPDNVMLGSDRDGLDVVKVVDFGIAKASGAGAQQVTRTGLIVGTPEYMSPEQLSGDPVDHRSDVYALGLVAYTMLTGGHPYPSETIADTLVQRLTAPPLRLTELRPEVAWPPAVQATLDRALARRAVDRFDRAGDFARALAAALGDSGLITAGGVALSEAATRVMAAPAPAAPPMPAAPPTMIEGSRTDARADAPTARVATPAASRRGRPTALLVLAAVLATAAAGASYLRAGDGDRVASDTSSAATGREAPAPVATDSQSVFGPGAPDGPTGDALRLAASSGPVSGPSIPRDPESAAGPFRPPAPGEAAIVQSPSDASSPRERVAEVERLLIGALQPDAPLPGDGEMRAALRTLEPLRSGGTGEASLDLRVRFLHAVFVGFADQPERACDELLALPTRQTLAALPADLVEFANRLRTNCEQPGGAP